MIKVKDYIKGRLIRRLPQYMSCKGRSLDLCQEIKRGNICLYVFMYACVCVWQLDTDLTTIYPTDFPIQSQILFSRNHLNIQLKIWLIVFMYPFKILHIIKLKKQTNKKSDFVFLFYGSQILVVDIRVKDKGRVKST